MVAQRFARARQCAVVNATMRGMASGPMIDRNIALRRRWSSPSITMTLPKSWISDRDMRGMAKRRVKRSAR
ncbi:MAG TPA: hypothetical protein VGU24_08630 [Microvirga sp.]|nr:hypothetical protein [Microvirga sp.]